MTGDVRIRELAPGDSLSELTALVRSAYKQLADMGFRYWGTWQSEDDTRQRCSQGHCLVAESRGRLVGTVTVKLAHDEGDPDWYRAEGVWVVTQFAVAPEFQRSGLGSRLLVEAEKAAFERGASESAIDTAEGAKHLIDFYARRGYRLVGSVDWSGTNYVSVLMSKRLRPLLRSERLVLRDVCATDLPMIMEMWADDRFQSCYPPGRLTPEHCLEVFEPEIERLQSYPRLSHQWAIEHGGQFVGTVRLSLERSATGTLGYGLRSDSWGKGFATEAVREVVRYAFEELGQQRVQAWVYANNTASIRVLERLGFRYEGALREKIDWGDARIDDNIYGLLRHEWDIA